MEDQSLLNDVRAKAEAWTQAPHDDDTRTTVRRWLDACEQDEEAREALIDAFYTDLSFGTGGLRGKMGPGTNRINATTIANATQGLANHLKKVHGEAPADAPWRVAVACDSRHRSQEFAQITAEVLSANGLKRGFTRTSSHPAAVLDGARTGRRGRGGRDRESQPFRLQRVQGLRLGWRSGRRARTPSWSPKCGPWTPPRWFLGIKTAFASWTPRGTNDSAACLPGSDCLHAVARLGSARGVHRTAWNRRHCGAAGLEGVWISQRPRGSITGHPRRRLPHRGEPQP